VSALGVLAIVLAGSAILLPFLLAAVVAYVLFPAVRAVERLRVPRWVAIILVYIVTLGSITAFSWATIPRFLSETKKLSTELPRLLDHARHQWLPALDTKLAQWSGLEPGVAPPNGGATPAPGPSDPSAPTSSAPPAGDVPTGPAPVLVVPRPQGGFEIQVREDLELRQTGDGAWALKPAQDRHARFSTVRALQEAFEQASDYAQSNAGELLKLVRGIVAGLSRGIFYLFITLMLAGYMMHTYERIHAFFRVLWPEHRRAAFDRYLVRLNRGIAGVVRGQLIICLVNGLLTAVGLWLFDLKYWPVLSVIAAAMSLIPIFGSILSSIPAVAIGLTQGLGTALAVLAWIVGIHQLEANLLNPKIIGDAAKIHPVLVVFSLLVGEHFFGIPGALLAVPCLAIVQVTFLHFRESVLGLPASADGEPPEEGTVSAPATTPSPAPSMPAASSPGGAEPDETDARD
jgi:predicted PurR-regulated permease PerM